MKGSGIPPSLFFFFLLIAAGGLSAQIKNLAPLFSTLDMPVYEDVLSPDEISLSIYHSSIFQFRATGEWLIRFDMETTEVDLSIKKTIIKDFQFACYLPILGFHRGFLDNIIDTYHNLFGFPDYGRSLFPGFEYHFRFEEHGEPIISNTDGGIGIGDIRFRIKKRFRTEPVAIAVSANVELPTGNPHRGFGNGSIDVGAKLLLETTPVRRLRMVANLGYVLPGDFRGLKRVKTRNFFFCSLNTFWALKSRWTLCTNLSYYSPIFEGTGIPFMDNPVWVITFGCGYRTGKNRFEFHFSEDLNTSGAPDFSVKFSVSRSLE